MKVLKRSKHIVVLVLQNFSKKFFKNFYLNFQGVYRVKTINCDDF